ncbi:MAG: ParB/RepB/Spo0J family partition protein [Shimia sp.]
MKKPLYEMKPGDEPAQKVECLGVILLEIEKITVGDRIRIAREDGIATLVESIVDLGGIVEPIKVRSIRGDNARFEVIDGVQRLEAAKRLGMEKVLASVWTGPELWAAQVEVDSNLSRAHLDAVELAFFLYDCRELYFKRYPAAERGQFRGNGHTGSLVGDKVSATTVEGHNWGIGTGKPPKLMETLALVYGKNERTLFRLLKAGGAVPKHRRKDVLALDDRPTMSALTALAGVDEEARRDRIIAIWLDGGKTLDEALEQVLPSKDRIPQATKIANGIRIYWSNCKKRQRREFVKDNLEEMRALVAEIDAENG